MNWMKRFCTAFKVAWNAAGKVSAEAKSILKLHEFEAMSNFTPRAQQVLALARMEADRLGHHFVGTEHLLLGIVRLKLGVAFNVLTKFGLQPDAVRAEIEKQVGQGVDLEHPGNTPFTPRVKVVMALAVSEARALNHAYVGTEHIFLGLLHDGDNVAALVLKRLGLDLLGTRLQILKELDPNFGTVDEGQSERG